MTWGFGKLVLGRAAIIAVHRRDAIYLPADDTTRRAPHELVISKLNKAQALFI
jgi:hypothetical protein